MTPDSAQTFAEYHRRRGSELALRWAATSGILVAGVVLVIGLSGAPGSSVSDAGIPSPVQSAAPSPAPTQTVANDVLAAPEADSVAPAAPVGVAADGRWRIAIATSGYQDELDACQWVRMDLAAAAPVVGAHTSCGGSIVLEMAIGDAVTLTGEGLDGDYVVAVSRDAHAGDVAATATEGMDAVVILQTCYPGVGGRLRLLALLPNTA